MKVPYGKDGDLTISDTDSDAFPDAIVSRTSERMKFLAKPIPVEKSFAKATYTDDQGKRRKSIYKASRERRQDSEVYAKKRLGIWG